MTTELVKGNQRAITIRPMGGLGNQLFIYGAGRSVANRLDVPLLIDTSHYSRIHPGDTPRVFELEWLVKPTAIMAPRPAWVSARLTTAFHRRLPSFLKKHSFYESSFAYDPRIESVVPGTRLFGYFQSWRYLAGVESVLREEIISYSPRSCWFEDQCSVLSSLGPWLGVHVRRGDYLNPKNQSVHGVVGEAYYEDSFRLASPNRSLPLVLFSDDPTRALEVVRPLYPVSYVVMPPPGTHPVESLLLMALAHATVISNSSFGWWGAWLKGTDGGTIVAPRPWFTNDSLPSEDLCPPSWIQIDRGGRTALQSPGSTQPGGQEN